MKKIVNLFSILLLSSALIGCKEEPKEPTLEKTKLNYTYSDYCSNYYRTSNAIPNVGEPNLLIIPVYFSNSSTFIPEDKKETVKNDIQTAFFGTKEEVGFESVSSYYSTLSSGKCTLKGKVTDWISIEDSYEYYALEEENTSSLCTEIVDRYFTESGEDRTKYDLDKNGFLDGVVLIYGCPDYENLKLTNSGATNLWAYTNWIANKANADTPTVCNFMWASYDFMYSRSVGYTKTGYRAGGGDGTNSDLILDTHIFIHETGHMFGLSDYYDYSYQYSPAGAFSMQDHNIGSHDPYSVMALGWCDPYIPSESCTIELNTFQSSRECIVLSNSWNELNSPFDEYMIIELWSPDGLNKFDHDHKYQGSRATGPDEIGIRLWHVDARLVYDTLRDATKTTCDPTYKSSKVAHMMSNTYSGSSYSRAYTSPLGSAYTNYNLLQLIRNEEVETYQPHNSFDKFSLFKNGSKFSMNTFGKQFVNKGKLNSNKVLGWTFTVEITDSKAKLQLTRTI